MGTGTDKFMTTIILTPRDARKYKRIVNKVRRKLHTDEEYNAFYNQVLTSDRYSYDVKQKFVLWLCNLKQARLWGFKNLSGEALYVFAHENLENRIINVLSLEDLQALASNPAFAGSVDSEFDTFNVTFARRSDLTESVRTVKIKTELLAYVAHSPNMNLGVAEMIVNSNERANSLSHGNAWIWEEREVLDWTRKTYDMGDIPDSWVRQFLLDVIPA
jgi:hypothetical protein